MTANLYTMITGGDRGIGRAIVRRFASAGFNVVFTYHSRRDLAEEVSREVRGFGVEAVFTRMDVSDLASVEEAYRHISARVPYLNVLVNNAGVISFKPFKELTLEEWNRVIAVDLTGLKHI